MKTNLHQWLLVGIALLGISPASAYDFQVNGIYYNINEDAVTVTNETGSNKANSYSGEITIPESVTYEGKTYLVTRIGERAFSGCSDLTSISIPESVTIIENEAFADCNGLTSVTIPEFVTDIYSSFTNCTNLTSVIWNARACDSHLYFPFGGCSNIMSFLLGDNVEQIPARLCSSLNLTSITIPESVKTIGSEAFNNCRELTSISIPNSVSTIGEYAFGRCCGLTSFSIPESVTAIEEYVFTECSGLTSIVIPESITTIGENSFEGCCELTSITWNARNCELSNTTTSPFQDAAHNIKTLVFGENVEQIPAYLCKNMSELTSITLPSLLTRVGDMAFSGCNRLDSVTIYTIAPPEIWANTFDDYGMPLYVPAGSKLAYQSAKYWRNFTNIQEMGVTQYTVEVYSSDESMGTVTGSGEYDEGTLVTLAAIPASGYHFVQWSDGNTENPRQITVTENMSFTAEFSASCKLSVSSNDDSMGSVTAVLTATPKEGFRFVQWSDGNTENPRTVFVTESANLIAVFETIPTNIESTSTSMGIYVINRTLYVENAGEPYRVYTATGQLVYAGNDSNVSLADAGVYLVRTKERTQKVVVK